MQANHDKEKSLVRVMTVLALLAVSFVLVINLNQDTSVDNSDAIYGGKIEEGYEYATYMFSYNADESTVTTCGGVLLNNSTAITAAHCINEDSAMYLGTKDFSLEQDENYSVINADINPLWTSKTNLKSDLAVISTNENVSGISEHAVITNAKIGCNYEIVGYGQSDETDLEAGERLRKSAEICIENMSDGILFLKGRSGGVCFGDSGSPIFEKGTNRLVGVLSAIYTSSKKEAKCEVYNKAIAVNLAESLNFITENNFAESIKTSKTICGQPCTSDYDCEGLLICDKSNKCVESESSACVTSNGQYCSLADGIKCGRNLSCINNECKKLDPIGNNFELTLESTNNILGEEIIISSNSYSYILVTFAAVIFVILLLILEFALNFVRNRR